jgi:hypothetical protein
MDTNQGRANIARSARSAKNIFALLIRPARNRTDKATVLYVGVRQVTIRKKTDAELYLRQAVEIVGRAVDRELSKD